MRTSRLASIVAAACFAAAGSTGACAQALGDDYWVQLSGYWARVDTDIRVDADAVPGSGTEIDLEDDLGFDDGELLPAFYAGARLGSGFSVAGEYYSLRRDTTHTLARDIVVEDVTYPVNASVTAGFDTEIYRFVIGWAFVRRRGFEAGAAIGVHPPTSRSASRARAASAGPRRRSGGGARTSSRRCPRSACSPHSSRCRG